MNNIELFYRKAEDLGEFTIEYVHYLKKIFEKIDVKKMIQLGEELEDARTKGKTIFVIGNGGSATTATSMGNDLGFDILRKTGTSLPFKIFPLTDNNAALTAVANDVGYEHVFSSQLRVHFKPGDKLLLLSASGNSPNILEAAQWVKGQGGRVIGLVGFDGGKAKALCDIWIHFETLPGEYGPVEDAHLIINHILAHWFQNKFKP